MLLCTGAAVDVFVIVLEISAACMLVSRRSERDSETGKGSFQD